MVWSASSVIGEPGVAVIATVGRSVARIESGTSVVVPDRLIDHHVVRAVGRELRATANASVSP